MLRYFSTFSGIGGIELGIKQAYETTKEKAECIGYSEIDKYASKIYQDHFPDHKNYGDITEIKTRDLPVFDLFVGGFPCQAFSIAGKRKGFADTRGTLFFEIARILRDKQPRLFLLENVKGLLSHDNGRTFSTIIATLDELGYDLQWQVLNSKNHGVPQNRERVFIVGHLRGTPRPKVFPFIGTDQEDSVDLTSTAIDANYGKGIDNHGQRTAIIKIAKEGGNHNGGGVFDVSGVTPTLNAGGTGGSTNNTPKVYTDDMKIRRLTPTECERLQGFPDGWTDGISDTQRYKCLGNAVTVNVIQAIIERMI
jgi:DNA (cytosine-5)-methyltransferase 1